MRGSFEDRVRAFRDGMADKERATQVHTFAARTAAELYRFFSPVDAVFGERFSLDGILFRGHGTRRHPLLPKVFRTGYLLPVASDWARTPAKTIRRQVRGEVRMLRRFVERADAEGLPVPGDSYRARELLRYCETGDFLNAVKKGKQTWPPASLDALLALGQHHGMPTRLLDWTRDPYVAAYFAAAAAVRSARRTDRLVVWMLREEIYQYFRMVAPGPRLPEPPVQVVSTMVAGNVPLRAQKGVFLVHRFRKVDPDGAFAPDPYDEMLARYAAPLFGKRMVEVPFRFAVTLPVSEAAELLRLLAIARVDHAALFPTFEGVAAWLGALGELLPNEEDFYERKLREQMQRK